MSPKLLTFCIIDTMRPEIEKAIEEMMADQKLQAILEALGSDYDENDIPYWDKQ